ncbi:MAG: O-antigen ligase family protein, partial [Alphaproteobacteria bacterium]
MFISSNQTNKVCSALLAACIIVLNLQNGLVEVVCAITLLYAISTAIQNKEIVLLKSPLLWLIVILWIYMIIVSSISDYPKNAINNALPALRLPLFSLAVGYLLYLNQALLNRLLVITAAISFLISINAIIQFYTGIDIFGNKSFSNGIIIRLTNLHGKLQVGYTLSIFAALISGYLATLLKAQSINKTLIALISASLITTFIAVLLSGERAPFILITATLLILGLYSFKLRISIPILIVVFLSLGAYVNNNPHIKYRLIDNTQIELTNFFKSSSYGMIYSNSFEIIEHHNPIYGSGAKSFKDVCLSHKVPFPDYCAHHTHNLYLEILVAGGVPAIVIFMLIVILALKNMALYITHNRDNYIYISSTSYIA